jgi:hypothetical protein
MAAAAIPAVYTFFAGAGGGALTAGSVAAAGALADTAIAYGATELMKPKMPALPPSPFMPQAQVDQTTQNAEDAARRRQAGAQGIESTIGAGPGGMLNPSNMSTKTLLGQ